MTNVFDPIFDSTIHIVLLRRTRDYLAYGFDLGGRGVGKTLEEAIGRLMLNDRFRVAYLRVRILNDVVDDLDPVVRGKLIMENMDQAGVRITYR